MAKLGDLWVRLGLKKDTFSKGIKEAQNETRSFGNVLSTMAKGAQLAWAAVAAAVVKFATDAVRMTQRWGDEWNNTMTGVKAAYGTFVRQLSSGEGWDNLFTNMRETYRLAKEAAAALDEIFERKISYDYTEAVTKNEIARLDLIRRDMSKSDEEREAAARRIIELEKQLGTQKKDIARQEADAQRQLFRSQTGMNDDEIDFLVRNYNLNRDIIAQGRQYLEDRRKAQRAAGRAGAASLTADLDGVAADMVEGNLGRANDALAELDSTTSQAIKDVAEVLRKYDKSSDDLVRNMANAEIAVINVDTEVYRASARATSTLGSLTKASASAGSGTPAKDPWQDYVDGVRSAAREAAQEAADVAAAQAEVDAGFNDMVESFRELKGLTEERPSGNNYWQEFADGVTDAADKAAEEEQRLIDLAKDFNENVAEGIADGCQTVMDSLMGLERFNAGSVLQALLSPLADMAVQEGKILVASGLGIEAVKKALESLNGVAAITAGAALIAVGTAAKSGLAALAKSGSGSTAVSAGGDYGGASSYTQNIQTEMTIHVTGKISGNDIEISGQRTINDWSR